MYWICKNDKLEQLFEGILDERLIKVNEPMANHNTYGIGGNADVFVSPADKESLIAV